MDEHGVRPGDIATPSDLPLLPQLTKDIIRANSRGLIAEGFTRAKLLEGHTSCSSGTPLCFYSSREGRLTHSHARSLRALEWAFVYPGDQTIHVAKRRFPGAEPQGFLPRLSRQLARDVFVDCAGFSEETLPAVVEKIARSLPRALRGYANAVCIIAEFTRESGNLAPAVGEVAALPARVTANFGNVLGTDVRIDVVVVDRIEPTPAGRHLFLISKVIPLSGGSFTCARRPNPCPRIARPERSVHNLSRARSRGGTVSLYNVLARNVMAPAMDLLRDTHTMSCLRELEASQWWPAKRLEELQSSRLRALITHAYEHVPYYRRVMDERGLTPSDIRSAADLPKLPLLTKRAIRNAGDTLLADNVRRTALRPMSTSGSTGEPLRFYSTVEDQFSRGMARSFRALQWAGISIGDRHATLSRPRHYARMREQFLNDLSLRVRRSVSLDYGSLTDADLASVVQQLSRGRFSSIGGSPPLLCLVANHVRFHGDSVPQVNAIVCGGEQLFPHERRLLRDIWGPEPHSKYSSFEIYDIAGECSAHSGLHAQWEDVVVEALDERGIPAPAGHTGALCLTDLHNRAMPFIRYDIGDISAMDLSPCACGRNLPRLVGVVGRTSELIVTRSGRRVFAADLDLESFAQLGIRQYRLVQEDVGNVVAYVVWHSDVDLAVRADREQRLAEALGRSMGQEIVVTPKAVKHIEPTAAGKHMVVMSRLASRLSPAPSSGETECASRSEGDRRDEQLQ